GAAGVAAPDQELVLPQALVESLVVLVDVRERLLPRLIRHDDVRFTHWCLPSNVLVWIEHMPGETSSPPWPVVSTTLQSLIWRSPASPRNCRIDSAMPVRSPGVIGGGQAPAGVDRDAAARTDGTGFDERPALAFLAEAIVLELEQHFSREAVIELAAVNVVERERRLPERLVARARHRHVGE